MEEKVYRIIEKLKIRSVYDKIISEVGIWRTLWI